mmetsp:Transcript_30479/g.77766  ORF Transcript_30479/g.77766 Transcript_30479/m.77766 type:complete len:212 (+) Transcript_30479:184-819(+)
MAMTASGPASELMRVKPEMSENSTDTAGCHCWYTSALLAGALAGAASGVRGVNWPDLGVTPSSSAAACTRPASPASSCARLSPPSCSDSAPKSGAPTLCGTPLLLGGLCVLARSRLRQRRAAPSGMTSRSMRACTASSSLLRAAYSACASTPAYCTTSLRAPSSSACGRGHMTDSAPSSRPATTSGTTRNERTLYADACASQSSHVSCALA